MGKIQKVGRVWKVNSEVVNLYELYCVWLMAKYPNKRPGDVTPEMVREYHEDRDSGNWPPKHK